MKKSIFPFILITGIVYIIVACSKSSSSSSSSNNSSCDSTISYSSQVSPIISSYCATNSGCHGTGSSNGPGALTTYTAIYNNRSTISSDVSSGRMPQSTTLSSAQKTLITCWISNGAKNN